MTNGKQGLKKSNQPLSGDRGAVYEIRVTGALDSSWDQWFEGMNLLHVENGEVGQVYTLIVGPLADQPALHGLLAKIRDLNLTLISVQKVGAAKKSTGMDKSGKEELARLTRAYGGEWGINHTRRLLRLIAIIGEGLEYDHEVIWTAAHLHDWGAYSPWLQAGMDHALRSAEVAHTYLTERGCPEAWIQAVVTCIETHHQGGPDRPVEALLLSDADALDFLGVVGVLRDFARKPRALREAYDTIQKRKTSLPGKLCLERSRPIAALRVQEMEDLLKSFDEESFGCF